MPNELASDDLTTGVVGAITRALIAAKAGVIPSDVKDGSSDWFAALDVRFDQPITMAKVVGLVQTALKAKTSNVTPAGPTALTFMVQPNRHGRVTVTEFPTTDPGLITVTVASINSPDSITHQGGSDAKVSSCCRT